MAVRCTSTFPPRLRSLLLLRADILTQTVERRLPPKKHTGPFVDFSAFKSLAFSLYCVSSFLAFLGIYTVGLDHTPFTRATLTARLQVLTYIDVSAVSKGIDPNFSFYLLAIANACSAIGRILGGLLADRIGMLPSFNNSISALTILCRAPHGDDACDVHRRNPDLRMAVREQHWGAHRHRHHLRVRPPLPRREALICLVRSGQRCERRVCVSARGAGRAHGGDTRRWRARGHEHDGHRDRRRRWPPDLRCHQRCHRRVRVHWGLRRYVIWRCVPGRN